MLTIIIVLVFLALCFDFINGFHDAANSIATIIATGVLKPWQAQIWAAIFNFLAFFIFPLSVASTIGKDIITPECINNASLAAALIGAMSFNLITWWLKLPSSSSHALIGGLIGIGLIQAGLHGLHLKMLSIILASVFVSPLLGLLVSYCLIQILPRSAALAPKTKFFSFLQLSSSALMSLGHGGNDAQKTMGIIAVLLASNGYLVGSFHVPFWVVLSCYAVIALGTFVGGLRIVETVGYKITELKAPSGACAEFGAAFVLFIANRFGIPISSTHALTGAIVGVSSYNPSALKGANWHIIRRIFAAWLFTFPCAALFSIVILKLIRL